MTGAVRSAGLTLATAAVTMGMGCALPRPTTVPGRMIEPQLVEPARDAPVAATPMLVRLLETQSRAHIGRRLLHRQPDGELTEDPVWHWSSAPDRYLDTALRLEMGASPNVRLVDAASAPVMVATLLEWQVEYGSETKLVGAVEVRFTGVDRAVRTQVVRATEPVSGELPGTLAAAAGRLLRRLASDALTSVVQNR
jgi:hypothetical protein